MLCSVPVVIRPPSAPGSNGARGYTADKVFAQTCFTELSAVWTLSRVKRTIREDDHRSAAEMTPSNTITHFVGVDLWI